MALRDEPKGWRKLQAMAQRERDPKKLACIIDRMNRLLDRHEKMVANDEAQEPEHSAKTFDRALGLEVETWPIIA